jgi:predicted molibdopterin-dependent oxidoreductase YjgC
MLDPSMLLDAEQAVVLLPGQTRYEQRSGGTTTSTERRIRFTPEIPGHPIGESWPGWEIPVQIGRRSMPNGDKLFPFNDTQSIREEMSRVIPIYQGIEKLNKEGDHFQWGGPFLFKDGFTGMPNDRAHFTPLVPPNCRSEPLSDAPVDATAMSIEKSSL